MQLNLCPLFSGSSGNSVYGLRRCEAPGGRRDERCARGGQSARNRRGYSEHRRDSGHARAYRPYSRARRALPPVRNARLCQRGHVAGHFAERDRDSRKSACARFYTREDFYIGALNVHPFPIPHDAADPVGFAFDCQGLRCGVATDIGHISETWMRAVSGCQALVLEANHDVDMVRRGPYPQRLKQRILGQRGTSTTRTAPVRCASWRKAERARLSFSPFY